jgi:hypothetical protein
MGGLMSMHTTKMAEWWNNMSGVLNTLSACRSKNRPDHAKWYASNSRLVIQLFNETRQTDTRAGVAIVMQKINAMLLPLSMGASAITVSPSITGKR